MAFSNPQIDTATLPRAADLELKPLPEAHRREILAQSLITVTILCLPSLIPAITPVRASIGGFVLLFPALVIAVGALFTGLALIRCKYKGYAMREHDIAFRTGLIWRKTTILPFDRVQHAEVTQGPLQRRFGVSTLKFFTAGGSSVDLKIEGLLADEAEQLRAAVLARSGHGD